MRIFLFAVLIFFAGCKAENFKSRSITSQTILVLPLNNFPEQKSKEIVQILRAHLPNIQLLPNETIPAAAYIPARKRYRADGILAWLKQKAKPNEKYIALTHHDISTTKGSIKDWEVMGLANRPGQAAVASTYRLKNKNNFYKVVMHELAHTNGLDHCPEKNCLLRDAKGGDHSDEEKSFCRNCTQQLNAKGWKL